MHSHMITNPEVIKAFSRAGRATFTMVSKNSGRRFTFKVSRPKGAKWDDASAGLVVKVLRGPDNTADYAEIGTVDEDGVFHESGDARVSPLKVRAFRWFWRASGALSDKLDQAEIWHTGRCGRCGKKLTVPESISTGLGPICAGEIWGAHHPGVSSHV